VELRECGWRLGLVIVIRGEDPASEEQIGGAAAFVGKGDFEAQNTAENKIGSNKNMLSEAGLGRAGVG